MQENALIKHCVTVDQRKEITVTGVKNVENYDDNCISALTALGLLTIQGSELKISKFNSELGDLNVIGNIDTFYYSESSPSKNGFFSRLFR